MNITDFENRFLSEIEKAWDENENRLVYADWLEERAEELKAQFLRIEVAVDENYEVRKVAPWLEKLLLLSQHIDDAEWVRNITQSRASEILLSLYTPPQKGRRRRRRR